MSKSLDAADLAKHCWPRPGCDQIELPASRRRCATPIGREHQFAVDVDRRHSARRRWLDRSLRRWPQSPDCETLTALHEALKQALKADARCPKHGRPRRNTPRSMRWATTGLHPGDRLHPVMAPGRRPGGAVNAFISLSFELCEAYQFDWSEEGLMVGGLPPCLLRAHQPPAYGFAPLSAAGHISGVSLPRRWAWACC